MKKWDYIIIAFTILIAILPPIMLLGSDKSIKGKSVVIRVGSEIVKTIEVDEKNDNKTHEFKFLSNTGYVEIKDGEVRMIEMDKEICPNKVCSDTGWINNSYQTIVCVPNNILVTIEGDKPGEIDAQSY